MSLSFTGAPATAPPSKAARRASRDKKRSQIAESLKAEPQLSDREHARRVNVSPTTIAAVRKTLEAAGEVSKMDTRTDPRGYEQPARKTAAKRPTPQTDAHMPQERTMNRISAIPLTDWQRARRKD